MLTLLAFAALLVGGGFALARWGGVRPELAAELNRLVLAGPLPALIFLAVHDVTPRAALLALPTLAWAAVALSLLVGWLAGRAAGLARAEIGAVMLAMAFGNTTYLGYPAVEALYGREQLAFAVWFDQLGATLAATTLGAAVAFHFGGAVGGPAVVARRLLAFPPLWAVALGLATTSQPLPVPARELLQRLGDLTVPLMLLALGVALRPAGLGARWRALTAVAAYKLVGMPALVWLAGRALGLPEAMLRVAVLEAAMPVMFYALVLAQAGGLAVPLVADLVMASTLASLVSLPVWWWLLG